MHNSEWDEWIDYCDENGLDPEVEDFYAWRDEQREAAEEAAAERAREAYEERGWW